jgi:hypothetical protein
VNGSTSVASATGISARLDDHLVKPVDLVKLEHALAGITVGGALESGGDRSRAEE